MLLIIGIDPGTTTAISALNLDGELIALRSSKKYDLNSAIKEIISIGKPLIIGCDKKNAPKFVQAIRTKLGLKLVKPAEDMKIREKIEFTKKYEKFIGNDHERDALASAIMAYKEYKDLLKKIDFSLKKENKMHLEEKIKELVLMKRGMSVAKAIKVLEEKKIEKEKAVKEEPNKPEEILKLQKRIKDLEKEKKLIKEQTQKVRREIDRAKKKNTLLKKKLGEINPSKEAAKNLKQKEDRIKILEWKIEKKEKEKINVVKENEQLKRFISAIDGNIIAKKLKNLSYGEYENKKRILDIKKNDILIVDDAGIVSEKTVEELKDKIEIIICNEKKKELPFLVIDRKGLMINETENFAIINRKELENARGKKEILIKLVEDYKRERFL